MILGLDISTSIVGVAIVNPETKELVVSEHIDLTKIDSVFSKAELVGAELWQINNNHAIKDLFIETARSLYGLSFPRGTKGPQRKKMVIESVIEKEKTAFKYEMARGGKNYKKGTDDRADAIVIARAGEFLLRNERRPKMN